MRTRPKAKPAAQPKPEPPKPVCFLCKRPSDKTHNTCCGPDVRICDECDAGIKRTPASKFFTMSCRATVVRQLQPLRSETMTKTMTTEQILAKVAAKEITIEDAQKLIAQQTPVAPVSSAIKAAIEGKELVVRVPMHETPVASSTGKTMIVASSGGSKKTSLVIGGKVVTVTLSAFIK